jgi:hypothetical protein
MRCSRRASRDPDEERRSCKSEYSTSWSGAATISGALYRERFAMIEFADAAAGPIRSAEA